LTERLHHIERHSAAGAVGPKIERSRTMSSYGVNTIFDMIDNISKFSWSAAQGMLVEKAVAAAISGSVT
jgi:hypothetical protein